MFQTLAPFLKTLPIFEPALPYMAESPTVGKKFATATPTSALALIMFCSACRMSGRRRRRSVVSPGGVTGVAWSTRGMPRSTGSGFAPRSTLIASSCCVIWRSRIATFAMLDCRFASARDVEILVSVPPTYRRVKTSSVRR